MIYLAYSNDHAYTLANLAKENRGILLAMEGIVSHQKIEVVTREKATAKQIFADLRTYRNRIVIFHFAGHSGQTGIFLEGKKARAPGLVRALKAQQALQMVFLNGCSSFGQVQEFLEAGIPVVIATNTDVEDAMASEFAWSFYASLASGATIETAFEEAIAWIEQGRELHPQMFQKGTVRHLGFEAVGTFDQIPWSCICLDEKQLGWRLINQESRKTLLFRTRNWGLWVLVVVVLTILFLKVVTPSNSKKVEGSGEAPQEIFTSLKGIISDESLKPIGNCSLVIDHLPGDTTTSSMDGTFNFDSIPAEPGTSTRIYISISGSQIWNEFILLPGPKRIIIPDSVLPYKDLP